MRTTAAVVLMLVLALPAAAAQPRRATLKLEAVAPIVVVGRGFDEGERVALTASAKGARKLMQLVASRNGSFTARFGLRLGLCAPFTVRAVGLRGSRAILQVEPGCDEKRRKRD
jgi:hypothetical protein